MLEPGEEDALTPGIRNGYPNVVIRNGTVTNFGYGVLLGPGAIHSVVQHMTLVRNALAGVQLFDADNGRIGNTVRDNGFDSNGETGLQLFARHRGQPRSRTTTSSPTACRSTFRRHRNVIRNNTISGIILDPALDSDAGIVVENGSRRQRPRGQRRQRHRRRRHRHPPGLARQQRASAACSSGTATPA